MKKGKSLLKSCLALVLSVQLLAGTMAFSAVAADQPSMPAVVDSARLPGEGADAETVAVFNAFKDRQMEQINHYVDQPSVPIVDGEGGTGEWGQAADSAAWSKAGYAFAALWANRDVDRANQFVVSLCKDYPPTPGTQSYLTYFCMNLMMRTWFSFSDKSELYPGRLTKEAQAALEDWFWQYLSINDGIPTGAEFSEEHILIKDSGNHDLVQSSSFYIGSQLLLSSGNYADKKVAGRTLQQYHDTWAEYLREYFSIRGRKGLIAEAASPSYPKFTMDSLLSIYDFGKEADVHELCEAFLDNYYTDLIMETSQSRGGAKSRSYKNYYSVQGIADAGNFYNYVQFGIPEYKEAYNTGTSKCHPSMLSTCATSYQAPYVLYDFAVHPEAKGSYLYESTPLGRGGNGSTYKALLPSMTLKQTYVTPDYILGAVTIDRTQEYMKIHSQNKWMGVIFEGGLAEGKYDSRVYVTGNGTSHMGEIDGYENRGTTGYNEIDGIGSQGALLVQGIPERTNCDDTLVYISNDLYSTKAEEDGWLFAYDPDGTSYVAIKPSRGSIKNVADFIGGKYINFTEDFVPIIIQCASKTDYASFDAFKAAVKGTQSGWTGNTFSYQNLKGEVLELSTEQNVLPKKNGVSLDLTPELMYNSPYVKGVYGSGIVTVTNTKNETFTIDFNVPTDPLNSKLIEARAIVEGNYTIESYAALQTAIHDAEAVHDKPDASESEILLAIANLQTAIDGLKAYIPQAVLVAPDYVTRGQTFTPSIKLTSRTGELQDLPYALNLYAEDPDLLSIGANGTVTAQNRGATTLHASFASFAALPSDALYYYLEALTANSLYENDFSYADMSAFQGKNPGNLTVSDGILTVGNGVAAYYNGEGAKEWKNYKYSGKIKFGDLGPDVILRAQDEKNHMMVSFGIKSLIIYTCIGGTYESKADIPYSCLAADGFDEFEIYAIGDTYIVYVNGTLVTIYQDDTYQTGSVGFRTSSRAKYTADDIKVEVLNDSLSQEIVVEQATLPTDPLKEKLVEARAIEEDAYTVESFAVLQTAIQEAQKVMDKETVTEDEVMAAVRELQAAMDALVVFVPQVVLDAPASVTRGDTFTPALKLTTRTGALEDLPYTSSLRADDDLFTVNADGSVTAKKAGSTVLRGFYDDYAALPAEFLPTYLNSLTAETLYSNDFSNSDMSAFKGKNVGNLSVGGGILNVGNGVTAYYDGEGAKEWKNYKYSGTVKFGDLSPDVILRAQDEKNHMMVSFGYKSLLFYTCVNGTYTQIQNISYATLGQGDTADFEIYAIGSTYIVYVNGALVMVYEDDTYQTGSVGFRTSGKAAYTADHIKVQILEENLAKEIVVEEKPVTADADKEVYGVNEPITVTVIASEDWTRPVLRNEYGTYLATQWIKEPIGGGDAKFTLTFSLSTKGERDLDVLLRDGEGNETDANVNVSFVIGDAAVAPEVPAEAYSVKVPATGAVNQPLTFTIKTSTSVSKVALFNESGVGLAASSVSYVDQGDERTWTYTIAVGTPGKRTFVLKIKDAAGSQWLDTAYSAQITLLRS